MSQNQFDFTIAMALEDFIPVAFTAISLSLIARFVSGRFSILAPLAWSGSILVVMDGLLKAVWKLIYAATGTDIAWMHDTLFLLMGPGFIFVAWSLWRGLKDESPTSRQVWFVPLVIVLPALATAAYLAFTQPGRSWARVLLLLTTIGILSTNGLIIMSSIRRNLFLPVILLIINILTIVTQVWISQMVQTTAIHWVGQINNTLSWGAFVTAIWLWLRHLKSENIQIRG
jgi:hypothetical protein